MQKSGHDVAPKWVAAEDEQEPYESRRLWRDLTRAILAKDMDAATEAKMTVENAQRELRATGVKHTTRFFEMRDDNSWVPRIQCVFFFCRSLSSVSSASAAPANPLKRKIRAYYTTVGFHRIHKRPPPQYKRGYGPNHPRATAHQQTTEAPERVTGCLSRLFTS